MTSAVDRPAFYAVGAGDGGVRDWVTLLHPPYTAWHLSYVAVGATLAPSFTAWRLAGTLLAFFLAVGVAAHALDELAGRPLRTGIAAPVLAAVAGVGVAAPVVAGWVYGGVRLLPFIVVGSVVVVAYNLELFGGLLHNGPVFALGWGTFPVLVGCYAQGFRLTAAAAVAAVAAYFLSLGQRALSTPVRTLRRRTASVHGQVSLQDGTDVVLDREALLAPLERALRVLASGVVCVAVALVVARWS